MAIVTVYGDYEVELDLCGTCGGGIFANVPHDCHEP